MIRRTHLILAMSVVAVTLVAPLMAQSVRLTANIPFEFTIGNKTLPAGDYMIMNGSDPYALMFQGKQGHVGALVLTKREDVVPTDHPERITRLQFNKYGDRYFLSKVDDGWVGSGFVVRPSRPERELEKTASAEHFEVLATLAQR